MNSDDYPLERIREAFPALQRIENNHFVGYFDGPGGTQVAKTVVDAMALYMKNGVANEGGVYNTSKETTSLINEARHYAASLLGAQAKNIIFGANMTTLIFRIAQTIANTWEHGKGNIVLTEMDHHANVDPWEIMAERKALTVRKFPIDVATRTLDCSQVEEIITGDTKVVAIGLASNAIGTINDCLPVIRRAKEVGAFVVLDGVHAVPHIALNFANLGADFLLCSAYKFFGPHVGIAAIKTEIETKLFPDKLTSAPNTFPEVFETGTLNFEGLIGITETVKFIASIGEGNLLREQIVSAYKKINQYETELANYLREQLTTIDRITLYQAPVDVMKTPTIAFTVGGVRAQDLCSFVAEHYGLHIEYGNFYAATLVEKLNPPNEELIRIGISPYNTFEEVERLLIAIKEFLMNE